ncbi:MAG TPA: hypothetical protein VLA69_03870 [Gaiellaceae bacterium]|nr:hypothetical protein [Gaiellaceae bacterium]
MTLGLVALLALGLFAVTAAGCGGDDETAPPAETAIPVTPATEPGTDDPSSSAPEKALATLQRAGTPEGFVPSVRVMRQMLTEMQEDCGNTREELAGYTLRAIGVLRDVGVELLPTDVLVVVSTTAVRAGGIDCRHVFATYVNAFGG